MFHHRSFSFTGDVTSQNANALSSSHHQNENLIHRGNQLKSSGAKNNNNNYSSSDTILGGFEPMKNPSKTPSGKKASTRRRAFGDISNKKSNRGLGKELSSSKRNPQQLEGLRPRSNNHLPRAIRNLPTTRNTRFAILPEQSKPSRLDGTLNHQDFNNRNSIGKQSSLFRHDPLSVTAIQAKSQPTLKAVPVPDIERPAGRTWNQQLEYDLKAEDDMASISSIESILNMKFCVSPQHGCREMTDFWKCQKEDEDEEDQQVQEQIQAIIDREQNQAEEGLDSLYDAIDDLEIFSEISHVIKEDDLQGEEWIIPDLSGFDLNLSDDASFPL